MKSPKDQTPTYTMPLDELLELLGATRKTAAQRTGVKPERRRRRSSENRSLAHDDRSVPRLRDNS
jgi:hypothetical protein